jgi:adenosine kinase
VCATRIADPTGVGDAFRAGFLAGIAWRLGDRRAAQLGCAIATLALEAVGPQDYSIRAKELAERMIDAYGPDAANVIEHLLREPNPRDVAHGSDDSRQPHAQRM